MAPNVTLEMAVPYIGSSSRAMTSFNGFICALNGITSGELMVWLLVLHLPLMGSFGISLVLLHLLR